ncbi:hypothetical protein SYNTR_2065 [Candidatus Syntrophocurvum alkaliphilum]|uniref:Major facilitator superfamily (MFS) profile domain-containing protein n=1 Tax=Candidatus Syntrophocurvum alkaliphilum TaxID=2293317 RepID=A0A6I6DJ50_9FIRM|nr:MFS transporter [Candidatus Syntrophocurvum alkaliphilum]QGU00659.1 hypothetical protein SYNTR_2065 [Candidatus Syntrophocurvum alkaliphilum]
MSSKLWTKDFVLITLSNFFLFVSFQMLLPTLPIYAQSLGGGEIVAGLIIGIFTISALVSRVYSGSIIDLKGRKGVLFIGIGIFIVSAFLYNFAVSIVLLLILRIVHGLGWGAATTASGTVAADLIPPARRGEGLGYFGMANTLAMAFAPALGLLIIQQHNFSYLFIASTLLAIMALIMVQGLKFKPIPKKLQNSRSAIFEKSSFRTSGVLFFLTFIYGGIVSFVALYAAILGIENVGLFFTIFAAFVLIARPVGGRIVDRKGTDVVVIPGLAITTLGVVVLGLAQNFNILILSAALIGLGVGATQPSLQALTITLAPVDRRGAATATYFSSFDLGIGLGAICLGILSTFVGYANMYLISSIAGVTGLLLYCLLLYGDKGGGIVYKQH